MCEILNRLNDALERVEQVACPLPSFFRDIPPDLTEEIRQLIVEWSELSPQGRLGVTEGLLNQTRFGLLDFARKMAVLGVRENRVDLIYSGLLAVAIENAGLDPRDTLMALCVLYNSAKKLVPDAAALLAEASLLAAPDMAKTLRGFPKYPSSDLRKMGHREVQTSDGFDYQWVG